MAIRIVLVLVVLFVAAGCATVPPASVPTQERPAFVQYQAGQGAQYRLDAPDGGTLTQRGPCLGIVREGRFSTLIWPETARIDFDARGLVIKDAGGSSQLRLGDHVEFRGGPIPRGMTHALGEGVLSVDMPIACARYPGYEGWIAIVNPGFRKGRDPH